MALIYQWQDERGRDGSLTCSHVGTDECGGGSTAHDALPLLTETAVASDCSSVTELQPPSPLLPRYPPSCCRCRCCTSAAARAGSAGLLPCSRSSRSQTLACTRAWHPIKWVSGQGPACPLLHLQVRTTCVPARPHQQHRNHLKPRNRSKRLALPCTSSSNSSSSCTLNLRIASARRNRYLVGGIGGRQLGRVRAMHAAVCSVGAAVPALSSSRVHGAPGCSMSPPCPAHSLPVGTAGAAGRCNLVGNVLQRCRPQVVWIPAPVRCEEKGTQCQRRRQRQGEGKNGDAQRRRHARPGAH